MKLDNFSFTVTEHIATLSKKGSVTKELNRVSYNGSTAKLDLRSWERKDGDAIMHKGLTLSEEEAYILMEALQGLNLVAPTERPKEADIETSSSGAFTSKPFNN